VTEPMDPSVATEGSARREQEVELPLVALARIAATGDGAATTKLLRVIGPRLVAVVRAILGATHPDVDDASQQALIGFVQALPAFRGDCDPVGYGRTIAVRAALAARRRARTQVLRHEYDVETDTLVGEHPSPRQVTAAHRRKELLRDLLAELPPEQAEALAMRVVLGCSLEEVASQTATPLNTVRSRLRLAKERLRRRIEGEPGLLDAMEVGE
jgi:RNA polymerase sigma-70 factor (ECF subfamily)